MTKHLVWIEWVDSCRTGGWILEREAAGLSVIRSIGWLVRDAPDHVVVSAHLDVTEGRSPFCDVMTIPKAAITGYGEVEMKW